MGRCARRMVLLLVIVFCASTAVTATGPAGAQPTPAKTFDLIISLEWQPGSADSLPNDLMLIPDCDPSGAKEHFVDDLALSIRHAAAYLYYYSEGQMALGKVTIYRNGENWEHADIRILANSSYRPTAFVGGIVDTPVHYASASSSSSTIFAPAAIVLSRLWDGFRAGCGPWSQSAGWRTIGHEWGHYGLFLYDEYFNVETGARQYCTTTGLDLSGPVQGPGNLKDTLMAYHYSADKLWLQGPAASGNSLWSCEKTAQHVLHGQTDWETVSSFYGLPLPAALDGSLTFDESTVQIDIAPATDAPSKATAPVSLDSSGVSGQIGQAYLIRPGNDGPQRIIGQGQIVAGGYTLPFWGVDERKGDRAAIQLRSDSDGTGYVFPSDPASAVPLKTDTVNRMELTTAAWQPELIISPRVMEINDLSQVSGLDVSLRSCTGEPPKEVKISYCPAGGACHDAVPDSPDGDGVIRHTFSFPAGPDQEPALHGYIYASSSDGSLPGEVVSWYQLAGGVGPAHIDGHAPMLDGRVQVDMAPGENPSSGHNRVLFSPAQVCSHPGSLPPNVLGLADVPFRVQPVLANPNGGQPWGSLAGDPPLRVRLTYDKLLLAQRGISEHQLVLLRFQAGQGIWQTVPESGRSYELSWIGAEPLPFSGNGEVYALGYVEANEAAMPMVAR